MPEESKSKPFYKKVKLMCWIVSTILNVLTIFVTGLTPEAIGIISTILIATAAFTTQHSITDIKTTVAAMTIPK